MNDPGLDGAIADEAEALDRQPRGREASSDTPPQDHQERQREPYPPLSARWWLASTAYPLAAVSTVTEALDVR